MSLPSTDSLAAQAPPADASLTEVQNWMVKLLRHDKGLQKSAAMNQSSALHFSGNERLSPAEQINIYRQQFWLRHTRLLVDDFPGVTGLLGQKAWEPLVEEYLQTRAYNVRSLRDLGKELPAHLESYNDLAERELLVDMARLEWRYIEAFDTEDDPRLNGEKIANIPPDAWAGARIQLSHSLQFLHVKYPVANIRRALRKTEIPQREATYERDEQNLVVYRREGTLWDKSLSRAAYLLLAEFKKGAPLVVACEEVVRVEPSAATLFDDQLMDWFSLWGRLGWITDVLIDE